MNQHTYTSGCVECGSRNVPIWCKLNKSAHTPTHKGDIVTTTNELREIWDDGYLIGFAINDPQANKIVKAVNCHEELVDFVKELRRWFKEGNSLCPESLVAKDDITWLQETERLIAKAEGKKTI